MPLVHLVPLVAVLDHIILQGFTFACLLTTMENFAGSRTCKLRQRQSLKEVRAEGLTLQMQQYVADQEDPNFTRAVLAALHVNIQDARAAQEAALCEAHQSGLDCNAA